MEQLHIIGPCCGYVTSLVARTVRATTEEKRPETREAVSLGGSGGWCDEDLGSHVSKELCAAWVRLFIGKIGDNSLCST